MEKSRRSSFNDSTEQSNEYMMMFRSTRVSAVKKNGVENGVEKPKMRFVPNKYTENRVRPVYSNYVKPKSSNNNPIQPEVFTNKA